MGSMPKPGCWLCSLRLGGRSRGGAAEARALLKVLGFEGGFAGCGWGLRGRVSAVEVEPWVRPFFLSRAEGCSRGGQAVGRRFSGRKLCSLGFERTGVDQGRHE